MPFHIFDALFEEFQGLTKLPGNLPCAGMRGEQGDDVGERDFGVSCQVAKRISLFFSSCGRGVYLRED